MRVEALVKRKPVTISPGASIKQAAEVFAREKVGLLVVAPGAGHVRAEAVLSERDLVRAVASGAPLAGPLASVATKRPVGVRRSDTAAKAIRLMMENDVGHLTVENDDGTLFGVLSIGDFFREQRLLQSFLEGEAEDVHGVD